MRKFSNAGVAALIVELKDSFTFFFIKNNMDLNKHEKASLLNHARAALDLMHGRGNLKNQNSKNSYRLPPAKPIPKLKTDVLSVGKPEKPVFFKTKASEAKDGLRKTYWVGDKNKSKAYKPIGAVGSFYGLPNK